MKISSENVVVMQLDFKSFPVLSTSSVLLDSICTSGIVSLLSVLQINGPLKRVI